MRESVNGMISIAHVQVKDMGFNAHVSMCLISRTIHVFKYNDVCCDYDVFDSQYLASQYLEKPLRLIIL
jgi:hypothetical protein